MELRVATEHDIPLIAAVHAQSWRDSYRGIFPDEFLEDLVDQDRLIEWQRRIHYPKPNQHVIVATQDNQILGFICLYGNESEQWGCFIDNLHVAKEAQGTGVGKQLMQSAAQWASDTSEHKGLYLEVLEDNFKARKFYLALGAHHQETNLWQPPGANYHVNDLLYVWHDVQSLLSK